MDLDVFSKFSKTFKIYKEGVPYENLGEQVIEFDAQTLIIENVLDLSAIVDEMNKLSYRLFLFGSLYDMQKRLVQKLEDEFESWKAFKLRSCNVADREYKSEKSKERFLLTEFHDEYKKFQERIADEMYKLDLLKRVVSSLENYSYKLHAIKDINLHMMQK